MSLKDEIREHAKTCGIDVIGFTTAEPFEAEVERMDELRAWYEETGRGHTPFVTVCFVSGSSPENFVRKPRR